MSPTQVSLALAALLGAIAAAGRVEAATIVNGSFESANTVTLVNLAGGATDIDGWVTTQLGVQWFDPQIYSLGPAPDGILALDLNHDAGQGGGIAQTISTVAGQSYVLTFHVGSWFGAGRDGSGRITVSTSGGGAQLYSVQTSSPTVVWTQFAHSFTATSATTTIAFDNYDPPTLNFSLVDDVSIADGPATIPEPATGALLAAALVTLSRRGGPSRRP